MVAKEQPIRILHLKSTMMRSGGIEKIILSLRKKSDCSQWLHHVALLQAPLAYGGAQAPWSDILTEEAVGEGCLHYLPWGRKTLLVRSLYLLRRLVLREGVHLVHCHDNRANFLGLIVGKWLRIPLVTTVYGWAPLSRKLKLLVSLDKRIIRFFDKIIASSTAIREVISGVDAAKIVTVSNSIDLDKTFCDIDRAALREKLQISQETLVIATVARLSPEKGHQYLIESLPAVLSHFPNVKVFIVGEGPLKTALQELARRLNVHEQVIFTGFYPHLGEILTLADIIVQPSLSESLPMSLLEGMAYGKPVVATDVGSIKEAVVHNVSGLLIPPGDSRQLADALKALLANGTQWQAMGAAAKQLVAERFSDQAMIQQIEQVYSDLLGPHLHGTAPAAYR